MECGGDQDFRVPQMNRSRMGKWTPSLRFGIPAACYLATNVLYLLALRSTAPPLWLMLIQTRTFYTVAIYLVVFGREVSLCQIMGCLLVVASLPLAHASELQEGRPAVLPSVLVASQAAAFISTMASIVIEVCCEEGHEVGVRNQGMVRLLLKNDSRSFCEQQTWLYCWSGLMAAISLTLQAPPMDFSHLNLQSPSTWCCVLAVVSSAVSGLCVPVIVRSLDTIAKDYLAALNNVLLALLTAAIFPRHFTLSGLFFLSLLVLLCGIWLYERKTLPVPSTLSRFKF
ncbi:CMP-sialic acid transporter 4 [Portunus trituberculatus]|uniref:CMP-sialic acid transporter 4 n=1 Tax=Portunus trituberculatus TaxID=210409 RepID=A0A5B7EIX2_PORTR|nr:CMP-sialic acid transporter 4 [Portunus trituberculatus]